MIERRKERGFTLTELLAVLVILAIIAMITYPIVTKTINNSRGKLYTEQVGRLEDAAKQYATKNVVKDNDCVAISALQKEGLLEKGNIVDPRRKDNLMHDDHVLICWSEDDNQYLYEYAEGSCPSDVQIATACIGVIGS